MTEIKDFTRQREPIRFRIDDDIFEAAPEIPAAVMAKFTMRFSDADSIKDPDAQVRALYEALQMVLLPDSYDRFVTRMEDQSAPIGLAQVNDVLVWLMEVYGKRPTQPASGSSSGRPRQESGMNSMGGPLPGVSIFSPSPSTVS